MAASGKARATQLRENFLEWVARYPGRGRRGFRESTREDYRRLGEKYALRYFGDRIKVAQVTPRHIANFVGWPCDEGRQGKRLSGATVRNILNPVRWCLATAANAVQPEVAISNPAPATAKGPAQ
jgi:hypothetical protein